MGVKYLSVILGVFALALIVASAFAPWFEWSVHNWPETQESTTTIWGPPSSVPGTPYGSVEVPDHNERVLTLLAFSHLILLLLALASLLVVPFRALSERWRRGKAAFIVAGGGLIVYIGIAVAAGVVRFLAGKATRHWTVQSTWIVRFEMQRLLATGPLLLLAGAVVGIAGALVAFHRHRA